MDPLHELSHARDTRTRLRVAAWERISALAEPDRSYLLFALCARYPVQCLQLLSQLEEEERVHQEDAERE